MGSVCSHRNLVLIGSEETGLSGIYCEGCKAPFTRRAGRNGEYDYFPIPTCPRCGSQLIGSEPCLECLPMGEEGL